MQADPNKWEKQWAGLGEALEGNELVLSDYDVKFGEDVGQTVVCAQVGGGVGGGGGGDYDHDDDHDDDHDYDHNDHHHHDGSACADFCVRTGAVGR